MTPLPIGLKNSLHRYRSQPDPYDVVTVATIATRNYLFILGHCGIAKKRFKNRLKT